MSYKKYYDTAIKYLEEAQEFIPDKSCGNGYNMYFCQFQIRKSEIFAKKGDCTASINALLDNAFCQDCYIKAVIEKLKPMLQKQYTKEQIKAEINNLLENPQFETPDSSKKYLYTVLFFKHYAKIFYYEKFEDTATRDKALKRYITWYVKELEDLYL